MAAPLELYDTTLRDGTQMEGISLSVEDKLKIARKLDELGVHYIEGGWPGSNPKDAEFFAQARSMTLVNAQLAAFGSTRRAGANAESDLNLRALVDAGTPVVTIVGKAHDQHATRILETTTEENLAMIADSVRYLKSQGLRVFFDAEHFFDGFVSDREYALQCLKTAAGAGADCVVLCDTNGGTITSTVAEVMSIVTGQLDCAVGIHAHNGADVAVANSLAGIEAGAVHVQAAANGYGDMCGNANMFSIIADLKLKAGLDVVSDEQLARHLLAVRPLKATHLLLNFRPGLFTLGIGQIGYMPRIDLVLHVSDDYRPGRKTTVRGDRMHRDTREATFSEDVLKHTGFADGEYSCWLIASQGASDRQGNSLERVFFRR